MGLLGHPCPRPPGSLRSCRIAPGDPVEPLGSNQVHPTPQIQKAPYRGLLTTRIPGGITRASLPSPSGFAALMPDRSRRSGRTVGFEPSPPHTTNSKGPIQGPFEFGGEGGIRTHGRSPFNGFQDRRFRPLSHLSGRVCCRRSLPDRRPSVPLRGPDLAIVALRPKLGILWNILTTG